MAANRPKAPKAPNVSNVPSATRERGAAQPVGGNTGGTSGTSGGRKPPQLTRAQIKAMEARAASTARATAVARGDDSDIVSEVTRTATNLRTPRTRTREGVRTANRTVSTISTAADFSIKTEMEYQRRDLVRLLLIAAVVIVIFAVLWFFLR